MTEAQTTKATNLSDLLARVEAATGPDRWLDAAITAALTGGDAPDTGGGYRPVNPERPASFVVAPPITASLDAALALALRLGFRTTGLLEEALEAVQNGPARTYYPDTVRLAREVLAALLKAPSAQGAPA